MPNKSAIAKYIGYFFYRDDISSIVRKTTSQEFKRGSSPSRALLFNIGETFYLFKKENQQLEISLPEFAEYLPSRIILANAGEQSLCFCCENINKLFLSKAFYDQTGSNFQTLDDLIKTLVCDPSSELCMRHQCTKCKIWDNLLTVIDNSFDYCQQAYFDCQQWNSHRLEMEYLSHELLSSKFMSQMIAYADHIFISKKQSEKLSSQISSLHVGEIIYMMNVASLSDGFRHILKRDTSLTGKKFKKRKIIDLTIYDVIVYYNNFGQVTKLPYVVLTNNSQCTANDIWTFNSYIFNDLKKRSIKMDSVILWSNSDKRYFKNAESLAIFTHMHMFGTKATWNFHFNNHDQNEHDCVTGVVKKIVWEYCRDNISKIENTKDIATKITKSVLPIKLFYISKKEVLEHKDVFEKIADKVHPISKLHSALSIIPVGSYSIDLHRSIVNQTCSFENVNFAPSNGYKFSQKPLTVDGIITDNDHMSSTDNINASNTNLSYPSVFIKPSTTTHYDSQEDMRPLNTYSADSYEYCRMRLVYNSRRKDFNPITTNELVSALLENLQCGPVHFKTELKEENESALQDFKRKAVESCEGVYIKQETTNELDETEQISEMRQHGMSSNEMKDPIFVDVNHEELFSVANKGDDNFVKASDSSPTSNNNAVYKQISKEDDKKKDEIYNANIIKRENTNFIQKISDDYDGNFFTKRLRNMSLQKQERIKRTIEKVIADATKGMLYSEDVYDSEISEISRKETTNISSDEMYIHDNSNSSSDDFRADKEGFGKATYNVEGKEVLLNSNSSTIKSSSDATMNIDAYCNVEEKRQNNKCVINDIGDKTSFNGKVVANSSNIMTDNTINACNDGIKTDDAGIIGDECRNPNSPTRVSSDKTNFQCDTINLVDQTIRCMPPNLTPKFNTFDDSNIYNDEVVNLAENKSHISSTCNSDERKFSELRQFRKPKSEIQEESVSYDNYNNLSDTKKTEGIFALKSEDDTMTNGTVKKRKRKIKISLLNKKKRGRKRKKQKLKEATKSEQIYYQEFLGKDESDQNRTEGIIKRRSGRSKPYMEIADLYERNESDAVKSDVSLHSDTDDLQSTKDKIENKSQQQEIRDSGIARHFLEELVDEMGEEPSYQNESDLEEEWEESADYLKNHEANISLKKTVKSDEFEKLLSDQDDDDEVEMSEKPILDEDGSLMRDLNAILDAENDDNPFQCPDCEQVLSSRGNLKRHVNTIHRGLRPFMCPECSASFSEKRSMELHIVNVHDKIRPYICSDCGKAYSNKTSLATHIKSIHVGLKPYFCTECEPTRYFARLPCLKIHNERWHNPERDPPSHIREVVPRNYSCPICQSNFSSTNGVKKHVMFVHEKLKAFQCMICFSNFRDYGNLRRHHTAIHEGIKPYKCDECPTSFCDKWGLQKHKENIHMGVKKHICEVCHFPFSEKSNMLRHFATVHKGVKPFECKDCDTKYTQKASLKHHLAVVHNKTIEEAVNEGQLTPNFGNPITEDI